MSSLYRTAGKRSLDLALALVATALALPLMGVVAVLVRARLGAPVLYRRPRPGKNGDLFTLLKFRTMTDRCDRNGRPLSDDKRLTAFGRRLRRWSLDELPELFNVIRGEMSLVGPRPLLQEYLERYSPEQARRHEVVPGITGWAQINGRNAVSWQRRLEMDVWYVDHLAPGLDLRILLTTAWKIFSGKGISAAGHATMPKFRGADRE